MASSAAQLNLQDGTQVTVSPDRPEADEVRLENERLRKVLAAKVTALEQNKAESLARQFVELNRQAAEIGASVLSPFEQVEQAAGIKTSANEAQVPVKAQASSQRQPKKPGRPRKSAATSHAAKTSTMAASRSIDETQQSSLSQAASSSGNSSVNTEQPSPSAALVKSPLATDNHSFTSGLSEADAEQPIPTPAGLAAQLKTLPASPASPPDTQTSTASEPAADSYADEVHGSFPGLPAASAACNNGEKLRVSQTQPPADAAALCHGRSHWLYFVHPEQPAAGQAARLFFNRHSSDILRHSGRIQAHIKFNSWELESASGAWLDLKPFTVPQDGGADWWSTDIHVPTDAYEMNYIFSDGVGTTDNNGGLDFCTETAGGMTRQAWTEAAPERMAEAEERRHAEEQRQWEEADRERQRHLAAQDLEQAQTHVAHLQSMRQGLLQTALTSLSHPQGDGQNVHVWRTVPEVLHPGQRGKLMYNLKAGPLGWLSVDKGQQLVLHLGHNGWEKPTDVDMRRSPAQPDNPAEDWWEADVDVGRTDMAISFVVKFYEHVDNNNEQSYRVAVSLPGNMSEEAWFQQLTEQLREARLEGRKQAEEQEARKARRRSDQRAAVEAKVKAVKRRQLHHVLYTEPSAVQGGSPVTLFYNAANTSLQNAQCVFVRGGWNRWAHPRPFGPLELSSPSAAEQRWQVTIDVPANAYKMDLVFSNLESGDGVYDNCNGADYHLPVEGSKLSEPRLYIAQIAVEMAPICKVGGLGDVVTALGRAVKEQGHHMEIILPRYDFFLQSPLLGDTRYETEFDWGGCRVFISSCTVEGLTCFFIEPHNGMFQHSGVYTGNGDAVRFDFFCKAALEFLLQTGRQPDILHCHDWSTAGVAQAFWQEYQPYGLWRPKVVFTIHNADFGMARLGSAAHHCQQFTTVSPSYASEIGGLPAFSGHGHKFTGIRNGIDTDIWDPHNDPFLKRHYGPEDVVEGKKAARHALREMLGLTGWEDRPIVGVITRLTAQKGIQLIQHGAWRTRDRGAQFVLLGSAPDPKVQAEFDSLAGQMSGDGNAAFCFSFDEPLSHLIYAASDIILVPSMFEPCGLTQLIAMRYGTIPVVRSTGGLHDTVFDVDWDKGRAAWELEGSADWQGEHVEETNGFAFDGTDAGALDSALNRAIDAYWNDREWFHALQARVMRQDWSWARPALDYIDVYHSAMTKG